MRRFGQRLDQPTFLDDCLDHLVEALGASRGLIVRFWSDGGSFAVKARRPGASLTPAEQAEVSRTIVEQARRTEEAILWEPSNSATESIRDLGIFGAIAAPLRAPRSEEPMGVVYLDFRNIRRLPGPEDRELLAVVAELLGPVLTQYDELLRARIALHDEVLGRREEAALELDELLALPGLGAVKRDVAAFLRSDMPLLIEGESGTGKTMLAHAIANQSDRRPVVRATLGLTEDPHLVTSELFGHEEGSFAGALHRRAGLVEHADGGTLILDEVLNLSHQAQKLLLDFAQFGTYRPLGYLNPEPKRADVRVIATTHGDLADAIARGRFRDDLYFRLATATIRLPPLRERRNDVAILAEHFVRRIAGEGWRVAPRLRDRLLEPELEWAGNVRQLEAALRGAHRRAMLRGANEVTVEDIRDADLYRKPILLGDDGEPAVESGRPGASNAA
ncbi:MAG: sigma 54-interacting transcriptional regulator, partial [Myxococcota bacterium]